MSERRIRLDIQVGGHADHPSQRSGAGSERDPASEEHVDRFRRALTGSAADGVDGTDGAGGDGRAGAAAAVSCGALSRQQVRLRGAFDLFRRRDGASAPAAQSPGDAAALLAEAGAPMAAPAQSGIRAQDPVQEPAAGAAGRFACRLAERILVSAHDQHEARILVRDDVLPGVELSVRRAGGRWVVGFTVTDPESFALIEETGGLIASELAVRLDSAVEVQLSGPEHSRSGIDRYRSFFADSPPRGDGT